MAQRPKSYNTKLSIKVKRPRSLVTLFRIAFTPFHNSIRYNVNRYFLAVMVSMILKIFNTKHMRDKSKRQNKTFVKKIHYKVEGYKNLTLLG